eukprot:TCONS_00003478-protein
MTPLDDLRSAHIEGSTYVAYLKKSELILTAGAEGDVRLYPGLYDDETLSVSFGSKITSLAVNGDLVVISNDQNEVKSYTLPKLELDNVLLRFTSPINNVCINEDRSLIAAGSSDFSIKCTSRKGTEQKTLIGHTAPVLSVCFLGNGTLVSNSCDGSVKLWNISEQKCSSTLEILPKYNSVPDHHGIMSLHEDKKLLAIPVEKSIKVISTLNYEEEFTLENQHSKPVSNVCWSDDGEYLISSAMNGEIFCWNTKTKECFKKFEHSESKNITCLVWKHDSNEIIFGDDEGNFGVFEVPIKSATKEKVVDEFGLDEDDDIIASAVINNHKDDEDTNDGDIFLSSAKKKGKKRSLKIDNDDDDDDNFSLGGGGGISDDEDGVSNPSKKSRINNMDNFLDDQADEDEEEDEASISLNLIKEGFLEPIRKPIIDDEDDDSASIASAKVDKTSSKGQQVVAAKIDFFMQPAFQPSSTPVHLQHRFMLWNSIGIIRCHRDEEVSSIDVEFHNASTSHPLHIPNVLDNTMATLSKTIVAFACKTQDNIPSKLSCIHFGSWDGNKEWSVSMNENEDIEAIGANSSQIFVATSKRLLRVFTVGGVQLQLVQMPGPVVSIALHEKEMILLYHKSTGLNKTQCLGISRYVCKKMSWSLVNDESLFMKPESTVVWLGYSTEGTPGFVLSTGEILLLHRSQKTWIEIGNTKKTVKNKSDNYWVIGIDEQSSQLRCIYCKGANFPSLLPRPIPTMIPFQLPLCEMKTEKSIKEHELMKNSLKASNMNYSQQILRLPVDNDSAERQHMQLLMQLFALACKADREFRAVEICKLMPTADSISLAIQYASTMKKINVARKLTELAQSRAQEEEDEENGMESDEEAEELSDGEFSDVEIEETTSTKMPIENRGKKHPHIPARTKTTTLSRGLGRNSLSSIQSKPSQPKDNDEDMMSEDEEQDETQESQSKSQEPPKSTPSQNSTPRPKGNPFKISRENSATKSGAKGTDYFETLDSQQLQKTKQASKTINKAAQSKTKKVKIPTQGKIEKSLKVKEKIDFSVKIKNTEKKTEPNTKENENNAKKSTMTGFQLFLENEKEKNAGGEETDNLVPAIMKLWKTLSPEEKKDWNEKAKGTNQQPALNNNNTINNKKSEQKKETGKGGSVKSKLSSFAFNKT